MRLADLVRPAREAEPLGWRDIIGVVGFLIGFAWLGYAWWQWTSSDGRQSLFLLSLIFMSTALALLGLGIVRRAAALWRTRR